MIYNRKEGALTVINGVVKLIDPDSLRITDLDTKKSVMLDALRMYDVCKSEKGFRLYMLCEEKGVKFV